MATTSLQSFLHHHHHHSFTSSTFHDTSSPTTLLKLTTNTNATQYKLCANPSSSLTTTTTTSTSSPSTPTPAAASTPTTLELLAQHLSNGDFRQADEATRRLLIELAGEPARRRGYVFFSEVQFISADDLRAIDTLWLEHSNGRFGYSVQRRLWDNKSSRDFTKFFIRVGWMKKLDTEVEQYNYRAFPEEFVWELKEETPEGHLPLTNALRGTQLLASIFTHPAFEVSGQEGEEKYQEVKRSEEGEKKGEEKGKEKPKVIRDLIKPDYSF